MKKLFLFFILLLIALGLGFLIHEDPGYAMISYGKSVITTSIWVAAAIFLLAWCVLYFLVRIVMNIFSIPSALKRRKKIRNMEKYQEYLLKGISDFIIGDYTKSENLFVKAAEKNDHYINFLLAAKTAQAQLALDRRDIYLQKALISSEDAKFEIALTQAQLFMQSDQTDEALTVLKSLHHQDPKNILVLTLLKQIYFKMHEWESLKLLLPQLKKQSLISSDELNQMNLI